MTAVSRTISGIGTVGVISIGFVLNPSTALNESILRNLGLPTGFWINLIGVPLLCGLITFGLLTIIDRLISS